MHIRRHFKWVPVILLVFLVWRSCNRRWSADLVEDRLKGATHAVVTDDIHGTLNILTGQQATNVIKAVSTAKGMRKRVAAEATPHHYIQFYNGTNMLLEIAALYEWFKTDQRAEFIDRSGTLKQLQIRIMLDVEARRRWTMDWAEELFKNKEFVSIYQLVGLPEDAKNGIKVESGSEEGPLRVGLPRNKIPKWLGATSGYVQWNPSGNVDYLLLDWYGSYGLIVSPTNDTNSFSGWWLTNIAPGVMAYHSEAGGL
jgi:hypothetical protein